MSTAYWIAPYSLLGLLSYLAQDHVGVALPGNQDNEMQGFPQWVGPLHTNH